MRITSLTAVALIAAVFPVLTYGQKVEVDYDKSIDFHKYKTYTWGQLDEARMPLLRLSTIGAIDEQLAAKGLVKVDKDADLMVTYAAASTGETNQAVSAPVYPGYAGPPPSVNATMWTGSGGGGVSPMYPKGTLVVELMDPHEAKITWRAIGKLKIDMEKKSESLDRIHKLIEKMFTRYPPITK